MKNYLAVFAVAIIVTGGAASASHAQVVIHEDPWSSSGYVDQGGVESQFLQDWNQRHDSRNRWGEGRRDFGPEDAIRLLERRGYRVRDVEDVGIRYLVKATRGGDDLLVSVSKSGEIMGVVHERS